MTALPPDRGPDPIGEIADWIADKMPKAIRAASGGLARLAQAGNELSERLRNLRER